MKTLLPLFLTLALGQICFSQSISPALIASGGSVSFSNEIKVDWSIGEIAVQHKSNDITVSEGFHQGEELFTSVYAPDSKQKLTVYPNPNYGTLHLKGDIQNIQSIDIYDLLGTKMMRITDVGSSIQIDELHPGPYMIQCNWTNTLFEIHKIIKI
ncbi:MAG: T9SS type A sorting domain-containing protein [Saprospiraceae bacterium]|nr:T9SS type A sorting domain-containing protein [Saprospiraceae bacterium]